MNFLIDHNIEGYAILLLGTITAGGWLEIVPIEFVMFEQVGLAINASDMPPARYANVLFGTWPKQIR